MGIEGYVHSEVLVAFRSHGDFVVIELQSIFKVIDVVLRAIANAKVVNDEGEHDVACMMFEEAGSVSALLVAVVSEVFDESNLRQAACLWESVHTLADFKVDEAAMFHAVKVITAHDFFGNHFEGDAKILISRGRERCSQVKVGDVKCTPLFVAGYDGVYNELNGFEGGGASGHIVGDVESIAASSASYPKFDGVVVVEFLLDDGVVVNHVAEAVVRDFGMSDGNDRAGVEKANEFLGLGAFPLEAIRAIFGGSVVERLAMDV